MPYSNAPPENNGAVTDIFVFEDCRIRALIDKTGEPWFVAKDVCDVLGYRNSRDAIAKHCKAATLINLSTASDRDGSPGNPNVTIIPEQDVCRLIMRSRLPGAERLEKWIASKINTFSPVTL